MLCIFLSFKKFRNNLSGKRTILSHTTGFVSLYSIFQYIMIYTFPQTGNLQIFLDNTLKTNFFADLSTSRSSVQVQKDCRFRSRPQPFPRKSIANHNTRAETSLFPFTAPRHKGQQGQYSTPSPIPQGRISNHHCLHIILKRFSDKRIKQFVPFFCFCCFLTLLPISTTRKKRYCITPNIFVFQ